MNTVIPSAAEMRKQVTDLTNGVNSKALADAVNRIQHAANAGQYVVSIVGRLPGPVQEALEAQGYTVKLWNESCEGDLFTEIQW